MKKFLSLFIFFFSISHAATLSEISEAFDKRAVSDSGFENAKLAAKLGDELGNSEKEKDPEISARSYLISCKANYFLGDYLPVARSDKKLIYQNGYLSCKKAIALLEQTKGMAKKPEWTSLLAESYFMWTANFGRWFEDEGRLDALRYWKNEVKPMLELLAGEMHQEIVAGHGPFRALGWAWFSIPGGRTKAHNYLKEAYEKSLHPTLGVSIYPLNTAFFTQSLIAKGENEEAKKILTDALDVAADPDKMKELEEESFKVYGEHRMPEMLEELSQCREILKGMN